MPKATLNKSANQKVVVDSGSQSAQDYFSKGYQLMNSSGKYTPAPAPAVATPGWDSVSRIASSNGYSKSNSNKFSKPKSRG